MDEVRVKRAGVQVAQLTEELRAVFGADVLGVSAGPYGVRVHLARALKAAERAQVEALVQAHAPAPSVDTHAEQIAALRGRAWSKLTPQEQDAAWALVFGKLFGEVRGE